MCNSVPVSTYLDYDYDENMIHMCSLGVVYHMEHVSGSCLE